MAGGGADGGYQSSDDDGGQMISGINVTPLVDITLVLLIIFMVTTTYIVNPSIKVDLPKAASGTDQTKTTLGLTLMKDGTLYLNGEKTSDAAVVRYIGDTLPKNPDLQAIIAADRVVAHGEVVHIIDLVKRAGVRRFAINVDRGAAAVDRGAAAVDRGAAAPAPAEATPAASAPAPTPIPFAAPAPAAGGPAPAAGGR